MPGRPFGVVAAPGGWWFVAVDGVRSAGGRSGSAIVVVSARGASPRIVGVIGVAGDVAGETLTADGRYLLAATSTGAAVISVARAELGTARPVLGAMSVPANAGEGGIEVAASPDGRFAFVSMEGSARIAVFDLAAALRRDFRGPNYLGGIPVGQLPVGMAISPNGRWLYVTNEYATTVAAASGGGGTLSVIDLRRAEIDPAAAVAATVQAGCNPVRVAVSPDEPIVWVTARGSNAVLGFSANRLTSDPTRALVADVRVGQDPVGLAVIAGGRGLVVADSAQFNHHTPHGGLTVLDTARAIAGRPALIGSMPAEGFPRDEALEPGGRTLLVTNYASGQLEEIDAARLR
jgi:DNA-binding beta-propeller fold protein YncE